MGYQGYLISNFATGLDREVQPWLLVEDAFTDIFDGFVYRGVSQKRDGYDGYANGLTSTYTESRMVVEVASLAPATGVINGVNTTFTFTATPPLRRGTFVVNGSNPVQVLTDDGEGGFTGNGTGTIDYTTGAVSITFTLPPIALSTVTATYDYHPGLPVMGIMNFYTTTNTREMLVVDTENVNIYNPTTDRLDYIATASTLNGTNKDFFSWVNYASPSYAPRLLFSNGVVGDVIQQYDGTTITDYAPTFSIGTLNARQMFEVRDRLVLFQTIEASVLYPRRIRISGFGANTDNFDNTAPGAGFIDIPDNTWYYGADFNRDDILFFTEAATWMLKYTGNDVTPFVLEKIDGSRGSRAAFAVTSYLNRTIAASPRGLIISDGYEVDRMDNNIPDFSYNDINNEHFESCFSGFLDEERDIYLLYPSDGIVRPTLVGASSSDRILAINMEEDNLAIYRIPLSCMGSFQNSINLTWNDLTEENGYPDWNSLGANFNNWNAFPYEKGTPVAIGGGHKGEIWKLNQTEGEDNPQKIRDLTVIDATTLRLTTDWNNYDIGDIIYLTGVEGMTEVNGKQFAVKSPIVTPYNTVDLALDIAVASAYTGGGIASKVIQFEFTTKKLNPYINADKKVRCGWCYFYVSTVKTVLTDINDEPVNAYIYVDVFVNDVSESSTPTFTYQIDCTNLENENGSKKWVKIWINQTARFLQFRLRNAQAGAKVKVHAIMPGFQPLGRLV